VFHWCAKPGYFSERLLPLQDALFRQSTPRSRQVHSVRLLSSEFDKLSSQFFKILFYRFLYRFLYRFSLPFSLPFSLYRFLPLLFCNNTVLQVVSTTMTLPF
jgi:hypothetical protein